FSVCDAVRSSPIEGYSYGLRLGHDLHSDRGGSPMEGCNFQGLLRRYYHAYRAPLALPDLARSHCRSVDWSRGYLRWDPRTSEPQVELPGVRAFATLPPGRSLALQHQFLRGA